MKELTIQIENTLNIETPKMSESEARVLEKYLDKYSTLMCERIENKLNKK
jgi:hypothetical protein